jgi:hypothetical protein
LVEIDVEDLDPSLLFRKQTKDGARENRFTRTGRANETQNLTSIQIKRDAAQNPNAFKFDDHIAHFDDGVFGHLTCRSTQRTLQKRRRAQSREKWI